MLRHVILLLHFISSLKRESTCKRVQDLALSIAKKLLQGISTQLLIRDKKYFVTR